MDQIDEMIEQLLIERKKAWQALADFDKHIQQMNDVLTLEYLADDYAMEKT